MEHETGAGADVPPGSSKPHIPQPLPRATPTSLPPTDRPRTGITPRPQQRRDKAQQQPLPPWLRWSVTRTVLSDEETHVASIPVLDSSAIASIQPTQTYCGPSIPLGPGWADCHSATSSPTATTSATKVTPTSSSRTSVMGISSSRPSTANTGTSYVTSTTASSTTPSSSQHTAAASGQSHHSPDGGLIAVIVLVSVLVPALLGMLLWLSLRRRRNNGEKSPESRGGCFAAWRSGNRRRDSGPSAAGPSNTRHADPEALAYDGWPGNQDVMRITASRTPSRIQEPLSGWTAEDVGTQGIYVSSVGEVDVGADAGANAFEHRASEGTFGRPSYATQERTSGHHRLPSSPPPIYGGLAENRARESVWGQVRRHQGNSSSYSSSLRPHSSDSQMSQGYFFKHPRSFSESVMTRSHLIRKAPPASIAIHAPSRSLDQEVYVGVDNRDVRQPARQIHRCDSLGLDLGRPGQQARTTAERELSRETSVISLVLANERSGERSRHDGPGADEVEEMTMFNLIGASAPPARPPRPDALASHGRGFSDTAVSTFSATRQAGSPALHDARDIPGVSGVTDQQANHYEPASRFPERVAASTRNSPSLAGPSNAPLPVEPSSTETTGFRPSTALGLFPAPRPAQSRAKVEGPTRPGRSMMRFTDPTSSRTAALPHVMRGTPPANRRDTLTEDVFGPQTYVRTESPSSLSPLHHGLELDTATPPQSPQECLEATPPKLQELLDSAMARRFDSAVSRPQSQSRSRPLPASRPPSASSSRTHSRAQSASRQRQTSMSPTPSPHLLQANLWSQMGGNSPVGKGRGG